jgi:hypothetical protein
MAVTTTKTNKPINPRGNDQSPKGYNRAALYSGKALDFDGVNDSVSVADSDDLDGFTNFTYSVIVKADSTTNYCRLFDKGLDTLLSAFNLSDQLYLYANGTAIQFDYVLKLNEYLHFAIVFTGGVDAKLYVNGVIEETKTHSIASTGTNSTNFVIGSNNALNGNVWDGHMSNARLFNTALNAAQVADLYNNPEKVVPTGVDNTALKLWLPMQEGAGTTAYDGSGNGNHGTISGATYTHGIGAPVAQTAVIDWNKGANILPYSEELNQWGKQVVSVSQSSATAPDGSTNAYDLTDADSGQYGILVPGLSVAMAGDYVGSLFVKKTTGALSHYPGFDIGQPGAYVIIDTTNGTTATAGTGGVYSDVTITSHNDDWWRVSAKATINSTSKPMRIWPAISENGTGVSVSVTGTNTFWGAQVEQADAIGPYVRTGATAQTSPVLLPQGLTSGRDITGVNLFENVRKQGALNLDGNSWAEVHDNESLDVTTGLTMECWVYINDITTGGRLISKWGATQPNRSYQMFMNNALVRSLIGDGTTQAATQTTTSLSVDNWYHIAVTYNQTNLKTYLNGVEDDSQNVTFSIYNSNEPIYLGKYVSTSFESVNPIAQPRIYNRALTAEEVQRNYNAGKNIYK